MSYFLNKRQKRAYQQRIPVYYGKEKNLLEDSSGTLVIVIIVIAALSVGYIYLLNRYIGELVIFGRYILENWIP